jgi:hypothetical protein
LVLGTVRFLSLLLLLSLKKVGDICVIAGL